MPKIPKLIVKITADDSRLTRALKRADTAVRITSYGLAKIGRASMFAAKGVGLVGAAAGGAAYAVYRLTRSYSESVDSIDEQAQSIGMSAQELREWQGVAERNGLTADGLTEAFGALSVNVAKAAMGQGKLYGMLKRASPALLKQIKHSKDNAEAQALLFEAIRRLDDPAKRATLATAMFGGEGRKLIPIIMQGAEAIDRQRESVRRLRGELTDKAIKSASDFEDSLLDLRDASLGLRDAIGSELVTAALPAIKTMTEWLSDHRGEVATKIATAIKDVATYLGRIDWAGVADTMVRAAQSVANILASVDKYIYAATGERGGQKRNILPLSAAPRTAFEAQQSIDVQRRRGKEADVGAAIQRRITGGPRGLGMQGFGIATPLATPPLAVSEAAGLGSFVKQFGGRIDVVVSAAAGSVIDKVRTAAQPGLALPVATGARGL